MDKPKIMSLDLETYSDVDLNKCGLYRYVEGDFHILLLAYAFDDEDVRIVDMACGERIPQEVLAAIDDPGIIKAAWNAQFERTCIGKYLGRRLPPDSWRCSMVHAASLSLPLSLKNAAKVLKTGEQKDRAGENLIRYFSVPCKPTKSNGGRTRNLPEHDPKSWQKFKDYCVQDVRTERDIRKRLERFPMLDKEWEFYQMDQRINDRGVKIDTDLVHQAIACDLMLSDAMGKRAYELTGLKNPNSVSQLKSWLEGRGIPVESLGKKDVAALITELDKNSCDQEALDMLKLRLQMAKSSVKKYQAAERCVCADGRARGLFQFYGASRTGRFCLTGDHEVLTPNGWISLKAWSGEKIACWNASSELISFQKAEKVEFDYDGPMYEYKDARISQLSTPDHKMRVKRRYDGEWQDDTVENMAKYRPSIPFTGRRTAMPGLEHNQLRILVMTQADGSYTAEGSLNFHFTKRRKIERCKHLLRREGIPFVVGKSEKSGTITIRIPSRVQPLWLRMFRSKVFGAWLLDENADVFFDELPYWDGYFPAPNSIQFSTCCKTNADLIQAFAHLSGRSANMRVKHHSQTDTNRNDAYVLDIWLTPKNCHEIRKKPKVVDFRGKVYCAVTQTGYFLVRRNGKVWVTGNSGRHIQIQNLPQNHISTLDEARELVKMGEIRMLGSIYGNVPDILSQLIRTMLVPKEGCEFIVADFSAIEARVLAWLAGEEWVLDAFRKGQDLYCTVASQMFHVPVVKHGINGELRQKGKIATLACGYQGGAGALISMGALSMGLKEAELPDIIDSWREANSKIVQFWWDMERAAVDTAKTHVEHTAGRVKFQYYSGTLWMVLPSGRKLAYLKPKLQPNRFGRMSLTFEGVGNAAGSGGWSRQETYGGKLVENCVAEGTLVLTDRGPVSIENVREDDLIWDGVEWVSHEGLINKGIQNTVSVGGIRLTPDHKILTEEGWVKCAEADRFNWADVSLPYGSGTGRKYKRRESTMAVPVHLREENCGGGVGFKEETIPDKVMRMHERKIDIQSKIHAWDDSSSGIWCVAFHEAKMHGSESSGLSQLRRAWYNGLPGVGRKLRKILGSYGTNISERIGTGSYQQRRLPPRKLSMGEQKNQLQEQEGQSNGRFFFWKNNRGRAFRKNRNRRDNASVQIRPQLAGQITVHPTGFKEQVYDIRNCGPRHRFAVYDSECGKLRIVSNCTQATARDILTEAMWRLEKAGFDLIGHVHDEVIIETPAGQHSVEEVCSIMAQNPDWCPECPLSAAGYKAPSYYFKD